MNGEESGRDGVGPAAAEQAQQVGDSYVEAQHDSRS